MIDVRNDFRRGWRHVWISTFTVGVVEMEDYLLNQLGEPPIEVTVLADADRLQRQFLELVDSEQVERLSRVGAQYVLRGIRAGQRFHPKTYFFGNAKRGALLVGSGNAGLSGLLNGAEVFARFRSEDEAGRAAIRSWRDWMQGMVDTQTDPLLRDRWRDLITACSAWLAGASGPSTFVTNSDRSVGEQFVERVGQAKTLLLTAPYFDEKATAVYRLVRELKPQRIRLWLGERPNVNGKRLREVLKASGAKIELSRYEGDFVHAKMVGAIGKRSFLLVGSPNLSIAGMWLTSRRGNCEAGVLLEANSELISDLFENPKRKGLTTRMMDWSELAEHTYETQEGPSKVVPVRLLRATRLADGRCEFETAERREGGSVRTFGATVEDFELGPGYEASERYLSTSTDPIPAAARLAAVINAVGRVISNLAVIDDPELLKAMGQVSNRVDSHVRGLIESDLDTPVGQLLDLLRRSCNFEYAWQAREIVNKLAGGQGGKEETWDPDTEIEFMAAGIRLRRIGLSSGQINHLALDELRAMLQAVPTRERMLSIVNPVPSRADPPSRKGHEWGDDRRLAVRLFNVLERWCLAIGLREAWFDELQEVSNFEGLVQVLSVVAESAELRSLVPPEKLARLVGALFKGFIGSPNRPGYFRSLQKGPQLEIVELLDARGATVSAGSLVGILVDPQNAAFKARVVDWKPWLGYCVELGLIKGNTSHQQAQLVQAASYMDDALWEQSIKERLGLKVQVAHDKEMFEAAPVLTIRRPNNLMTNPNFVLLVESYLMYRPGESALTVIAGGSDGLSEERLGLQLNEIAGARCPAFVESTVPITKELIRKLALEHRPWSDCFQAVAAAQPFSTAMQ